MEQRHQGHRGNGDGGKRHKELKIWKARVPLFFGCRRESDRADDMSDLS